MAYSFALYTGNGSTTQFSVPFGYISQEHVLATVAGSPVTFTWINNSLIQMDATPANGAAVRVYRQTPLTEPLVDFTNGSTWVAADLDTNARQSIYTQQELDDGLVEGLAGVIPNGDKGDITTSVGGTVWTIDNGAVTSAKIADGTIVDGDISPTAAIAGTKVAFTPAGNIAAATAQAAIQELDNEKLAKAGDTMTGNLNVPSINGGPLAGMRNLLINGNPIINQRGYVSGTATSGVNEYTLDRWRVVTSGQSITFTDSANVRTVTAPAGGIEQVIEGLNILSGTYVLNWTGTATATVDGTSVAKGSTVTLTGGTNATVRFIGGTFSLPQLEPGTVATPFERRSYGQELALCQRYYQRFDVFPTPGFAAFVSYYGGTNVVHPVQRLTTPMRATPTASFANAGVEYYSYGGSWTGTTLLAAVTSSEVYYVYCASDGDGRGKLLRNGGSGLNPNPIITFTAEL